MYKASEVYSPGGGWGITSTPIFSLQVSFSNPEFILISSQSLGVSVEAIKTEIMTHGPVQAAFFVWNDFMSYKDVCWEARSTEL